MSLLYCREVDIWAIGCLYAEMLTGDPLFPGESDIDQLFQITKLLGPLSNKHRQIISKNPMFNGLSAPNSQGQKSIKNLFPTWSQESLSFVKTCLNLEPSARSVNIFFFTFVNNVIMTHYRHVRNY